MTEPTAPQHCPLCRARLAAATLQALEEHFPDCKETESKAKPPAFGGKPRP